MQTPLVNMPSKSRGAGIDTNLAQRKQTTNTKNVMDTFTQIVNVLFKELFVVVDFIVDEFRGRVVSSIQGPEMGFVNAKEVLVGCRYHG